MRRVLGPDEFVRWLETFLPPPQSARFRPLSIPIEVRAPKDPRIGHLIGLAWERAACFLGIARALPAKHSWRKLFIRFAARHQQQALRQMFEAGYGGEHWLTSFALYSLQQAAD